MATFRTAFRKLVPSWLSTGDGELVLATLGIVKDMFMDRMRQGLEARFPTRTGPSALALIGEDRGIPRGRSETSAHYAQRLVRWRHPRGHKTRGSAFALLEQVSEYWGGMFVRTIDVNGNQFQRTADGVESVTHGVTWDWDGNGVAERYRFWIVLYPVPETGIRAWGTWTQVGVIYPTWGDAEAAGALWGQQGATAEDVRALGRLLKTPHAWKPAGTQCGGIIVVLEDHAMAAALSPAGSWGTGSGRLTAPAVVQFWAIT
jgi:hypothetical protein